MDFATDIGMTVWRVLGGFVIAAGLALPLGVLMGAYKPIEAFFEPFVSFARYLPASAFIPLLILWAGIGEAQKLEVIFIAAGQFPAACGVLRNWRPQGAGMRSGEYPAPWGGEVYSAAFSSWC